MLQTAETAPRTVTRNKRIRVKGELYAGQRDFAVETLKKTTRPFPLLMLYVESILHELWEMTNMICRLSKPLPFCKQVDAAWNDVIFYRLPR
jgi:hypothetical protein